jgi:hypothetical protein
MTSWSSQYWLHFRESAKRSYHDTIIFKNGEMNNFLIGFVFQSRQSASCWRSFDVVFHLEQRGKQKNMLPNGMQYAMEKCSVKKTYLGSCRNNAVSAEDKLLLTLRYYATGSFQAVAGDFIGVHKSTASQIVRLVSREIALLRPEYINFPQTAAEREVVRQEFYTIAKFPKVIGALDCTHVRIKSPGGDNAEIYRNRKGYFSMNVQLICDADLRIQNIVCRWPGSSHDSTIFNHSAVKREIERGEYGDSLLVGDSGYALKNYLLTPFLNVNSRGEELYNEAQIRTRNCIERTNGVWKRRFPVLALGITVKLSTVESIIVATAVLHNIARHFGDRIPRVSHTLERLIQLTEFAPVGPHPGGNINGDTRRATLVRYFESLENAV